MKWEEKSALNNNKSINIKLSSLNQEPIDLFSFLKGLNLGQNKVITSNLIKKYFHKEQLLRKIHFKEELEIPIDFVNFDILNPVYIGPPITILSENEFFLAIHKPPGIHGHALNYTQQDCILNFLRSCSSSSYKNILKVCEFKAERGLLYRLDSGTSGVLVLAKNQKVWDEVWGNFESNVKEKIYTALVQGRCQLKGPLEHILVPEGEKGKKQKVFHHLDEVPAKKRELAQRAELIIENEQYNEKKDATLLTIRLIQGIRHQIRAQLSAAGYPIVGDSLYGGLSHRRLCLHAFQYRISYQQNDYFFESTLVDF